MGKDFTRCEQCGNDIPAGKAKVHHTKYDGATRRGNMVRQIRFIIAETLIGWALDVMPDGRERLSLAEWIRYELGEA